MNRKYPALFSPIKIGGLTLKNRIASAPMTYPVLTADGCLTPEAIAFYELRAKGGAAVVTVSELIVHSSTGKYYPIQVITDAVNAKDSLAAAARAIRRHGAVASMELSHGGRYSIMDGVSFGPSDDYENGIQTAREMPVSLIDEIVEAYGSAAAMCRDAGFEMLLIHAGHGWLLEQFLSPATNKRTDEYGGSLVSRARLALRVIDKIRSVVGKGFPLELRISADECMLGGYTMAEIIEFTKLVSDKIDLLQVSTGAHHGSFDRTHPSMFMPRGVNVHYAEEIKKHVNIPVATIGALGEPGQLEDIIATGRADIVTMARALLADPYLPHKAMTGRDDAIVRCCRCFTCMAERLTTGLRVCALNPVIGSEYEHNFAPPVTKPKRVLIAGGGPGGMQCAVTAAERGHEVILCEKSGTLGGALRAERGIPFKRDLFDFVAAKAAQMERAGVNVRTNTPVTPELVAEIHPDVLVIAIGAAPIVPPIPGIRDENVIMAGDVPDCAGKIGNTVAILGGGLVGCEAALHLAQMGKTVTVIEQKDVVCEDANPRHRPLLLAELDGTVTCVTGTRALQITRDGIICETSSGEAQIFADTVIIAAGQRALEVERDSLAGTLPYTVSLGDCVRPANVAQAVFRGHFAALDI